MMARVDLTRFVPTSREEMKARGWDELDILLVSGDAYVDHPSFGIPLLARVLMKEGYKVGILAQPNFPGFRGTKPAPRPAANEAEALESFRRLGVPRLFVGVSAGVVDSMINLYTANKKPRSDDMYAPGGWAGYRPEYSTIAYSQLARKAFPGVPVIAGGVEASLRRLAHYDYWQNRVRPSLLIDCQADLFVFGMGEQQALTIARRLSEAKQLNSEGAIHAALGMLKKERGIAAIWSKEEARTIEHRLTLPSYEEVRESKKKFARAAYFIELESNPFNAKTLIQYHGSKAVVVNPPALPLSTEALDRLYELPFTKEPHFQYKEKIPAAEMIRSSVTVNRGCFGGCSFCAITLHQGRVVQSRSEESVLKELAELASVEGFKGIVSDLGGPTANMYKLRCKSPEVQSKCRKLSCVFPGICPHLITDHRPQVALLKKSRQVKGVRKVFVASGLRYDLALLSPEYMRELFSHHVGGHLKVAPEHLDPEVLRLMKKPGFELFERFREEFERISQEAGKEQFLVPYFISGFPGTTPEKMECVHDWVKRENWKLQQVQGFIPSPMALASAMYWTGIDPASGRELHVAKDPREKRLQQTMLQPHHKGGRRAGKRR